MNKTLHRHAKNESILGGLQDLEQQICQTGSKITHMVASSTSKLLCISYFIFCENIDE